MKDCPYSRISCPYNVFIGHGLDGCGYDGDDCYEEDEEGEEENDN